MIKENENKDISVFKIIRRILPIILTASPIYFLLYSLMGIMHGTSIGAITFMTQKFFDSVTKGISIGGDGSKVILMAIALGLTVIGSQVLNGIHNFMGDNLSKKIYGQMGKKLNEKFGKIYPVDFENPRFLDDISKADEGMLNSIYLILLASTIFTFYLPYFIFMGVYLYKLKPILIVSLILIFVPVALTQFIRVKIFGKLADDSAPIRREYEYYERCMIDREYYKETRLLGVFDYFKNLYISSLRLLNSKIWKAERNSALMELSMKIITILGYMGVLYLLFDALLKGEITVGAFGAIFSSIGSMFNIMEEIICRHIGEMTRNLGTVRNFVRFLEIPERGGEDIEIKGTPNISINNVSFAYPGADKKSLSDISLQVKAGETIAIVGENGAGKTTLVKLMTGIYLPTEGDVKIGGIDTSKISPQFLYSGISGVFQKYQRYKITLKENITISSMEEKGNKKLKADLETAVSKSDLIIDEEKFPNEYETMLSREFDGVDLSGGQWQRISIARGFYREHNMIVLDEPTAAIDPVEETKIYKKFAEMSEGKTSIIVTHRLGSAKIANRIIVMDDGKIAEIGNHEDLIEKRGKYAQMYEAQSKWYAEEKVVAETYI
ncbi:ABC transporter ATP-binding protein [Clostridium sp.]|uniref:ABC transporter ATP-binding protein n=1 Tax=Clostridium sp. TaxID=1506 RepID=UPI00289F0D56|nr:ABC transporter ATP-binding protein [Clostridium sp.]